MEQKLKDLKKRISDLELKKQALVLQNNQIIKEKSKLEESLLAKGLEVKKLSESELNTMIEELQTKVANLEESYKELNGQSVSYF